MQVRSKKYVPVDNLKPVLVRYLAYQASTSAVEQGFSKADLHQACGRTPAGPDAEHRAVRFLLTKYQSDEEQLELCKSAQALYSKVTPGRGC